MTTIITYLFYFTLFLSSTYGFNSPPRIDGVVFTPLTTDPSYYKLPTNVIPSEYTIVLEPSLQDDTFQGAVNIRINIVEATASITFHAAGIEFLETILINDQGKSVNIAEETDDDERQFRILKFDSELPVGTYDLWISYNGVLRDDGYGFYKSNYNTSDGQFRRLAATQFEATYARYAFPCFDEPALKTKFTISIIRDEDYNSISNMPLQGSTSLADGRIQDTFETTPLMSTYLVAFVISDFAYHEKDKYRVYSTPEHISAGDADFALDVSIPAIAALEEYTKVEYPLEKLYQIAIPHMSGAMENWGLVTYNESRLLYNKQEKTAIEKQNTEVVIAHEFVHQWFGDLVGPSWWSYLWLNEGFASFLQYEIGGKVKPAWRLSEQHLVATIQSTLDFDSLSTTRPMTQDAGSPTEISNLFDSIAYGKSGAVLRMLQYAIGEEAFREGLNIYLTKMAYKAATGDDLWNSIQSALDSNYPDLLPDGLTIPEIMQTWENQAGYPVVWAIRDYETGLVTLSQEKFLLNENNHVLDVNWYIPINYATSTDLSFDVTTATEWILPTSELTLNLNLGPDDLLIINKEYGGYYRTNYDETNWKLIAAYLDTDDFENIPPLSRAGLLNDAFLLARSGRLLYSVALELTTYLYRETDYIVWKSFFNSFNSFNEMFSGLDNYNRLESKIAKSLQTALEQLGIEENDELDEDDEHINILNRNQVIQWACMFGNKLCRNLTTEKVSDISSISLDLRDTVICGGLRTVNTSIWRNIYYQSLTEEDSSLKNTLSRAVVCIEDEEMLDWYLDMEQSVNGVGSVFTNILTSGNYGVKYSFNYLQNNLQKIYELLGADETAGVISSISKYLTTPSQLEKLEELSTSNEVEELKSAFADAVETVKANVKLTDDFREDVSNWLNQLEEDDDDDNNDDDDDDNGDDDDNNDDDGDDGDNGDDGNDDAGGGASEKVAALSVVATLVTLQFNIFQF